MRIKLLLLVIIIIATFSNCNKKDECIRLTMFKKIINRKTDLESLIIDEDVNFEEIFFWYENEILYASNDYKFFLIKVFDINSKETYYELYTIEVIEKKIRIKEYLPSYRLTRLGSKKYKFEIVNNDFRKFYNQLYFSYRCFDEENNMKDQVVMYELVGNNNIYIINFNNYDECYLLEEMKPLAVFYMNTDNTYTTIKELVK